MSRATFLLPAAGRFGGQRLSPACATALGRADIGALAGSGRHAQLRRLIDLPASTWPIAALSRQADAGDAAGHAWLRADPVHLRADISGVRLMAHGDALALDAQDSGALLPALRPLFGDTGFELDAPTPSRWYLRLPPASPLPAFADPGEALGEDMFEHVDHGPHARRWRVLASEAQVLLHNHPWNARRAAAGRPTVNGLWFWGGGCLPAAGARSASTDVHSPDPTLRALARAACRDHALPQRYDASDGHVAYDLVDLREVRLIERDWLQPALLALRGGRLGALQLDSADGRVAELRRWHRLRVWRRPLPVLGA